MSVVEPEKKKLQDIAKVVHAALFKLKMGQTGTILCSKELPFEEVKEYVMAYAFHKRKWFKTRHDQVSNVLYAERSPPPPWEKEEEHVEPDEP